MKRPMTTIPHLRTLGTAAALLLMLLFGATTASADDEAAPLRRPVDTTHPMFLVHIDTWNYPDPEKIIAIVPEDVRPWCVFNISLSVSHDETTGVWNLVRNGYETARSWVSACAEHGVWCTVQPASGGFSHLPDGDMAPYEAMFRDFPNFLGFNYCEQFWGFNDRFSVTVAQRLSHFSQLMELSVRYGGYLIVSWCGGIWHHNTNPVAMMKQNAQLLSVCRSHPANLVMCFKYTSAASWYNNESVCLGTFISGLTNNYGVRYDECGWALDESRGEKYPTAVGIGPVMENIQLTGMTVFDGPELIWRQCFTQNGTATTADGYTTRRWRKFAQYENIWVDLWRLMLDGTLRVPMRREVMERTQLCLVQDVTTGTDKQRYATPDNLYDGLYKQDGEGSFDQNRHFFKRTGRYGAIPLVVGLYDKEATVIPVRLRQSQYAARWKTVADKVAELSKYAPDEYEGTLYAGRMKNAWVTYYPYRYGTSAWASIPFKYNTCARVELTYAEYSAGLIHEYADHVDFYLNNYRVDTTALKTDEIRIYGSTKEPTLTWADRDQHRASHVETDWQDGVFTVRVAHCGAVELSVGCQGTEQRPDLPADLREPRPAETPPAPPAYDGPRRHEAECFDYKNVERVVTSPAGTVAEGYYGQGYVVFGLNTAAAVRDTVSVPRAGTYRVSFRYQAPTADVRHTLLLVNTTATRNGQRMTFAKTADGEWGTASEEVVLREGANVVCLRAHSAYGTPQRLLVDNMTVEPVATASAVGTVQAGASAQGPAAGGRCYDLQGRRVSRPQRGLYIVGGQKRLIP